MLKAEISVAFHAPAATERHFRSNCALAGAGSASPAMKIATMSRQVNLAIVPGVSLTVSKGTRRLYENERRTVQVRGLGLARCDS